MSSSSEAMKRRSYITVKQLRLNLEARLSKQLTIDDLFKIAVATIELTREDRLRFLDKSIKMVLKLTERTYDVILSLLPCVG